MKISEMATDDLKREAASLYQSVYVHECYGTQDILYYEAMCRELEKRGWVVEEVSSIQFVQEDAE